GIQAEKRASKIALENERAEQQQQPNTLFAALKIRQALRRPKSRRMTQEGEKIDEVKANLDRHMKVLSRYKIRRVDFIDSEEATMKNLGWFMVNPHSTLFKMWQLGTLLLIIYQSFLLPYGLAFGGNDSNTMDVFTSCIFAWDIVIQFNIPIAPANEGDEYITNRRQIARALFFDVIACLPFDRLVLLINNYDSSGAGNLNILGLLKALRVPRLLRLVRLLRVIKIFKLRPELRRWLQYSRHANLLRLVRLVLSFLAINHYVACIWYGAVASAETKAQDSSKDPLHQYFASYYTSILVVMGQNIAIYDDNEYVFCILVMVMGAVLMAVVFGNVAILIANYYESQSSHQKKMEWLFASMNRMKLPNDLQNRINDYYQAMWERHGTLDGAVTAFIPELSRNLAYEVELFLRMDMINRAPIFQNCSAKVVQELVMELELQVFMPGDYIVVRGEVGNDMYFVQNGVCEVTKDLVLQSGKSLSSIIPDADSYANEIVLKVLGQGDYFGEIALLMNCKRTANVRAQVFSELCTLTREVFESISLRYLEDRNIIEKFIMDKYDPGMLQAAMKQSQEGQQLQELLSTLKHHPRTRFLKCYERLMYDCIDSNTGSIEKHESVTTVMFVFRWSLAKALLELPTVYLSALHQSQSRWFTSQSGCLCGTCFLKLLGRAQVPTYEPNLRNKKWPMVSQPPKILTKKKSGSVLHYHDQLVGETLKGKARLKAYGSVASSSREWHLVALVADRLLMLRYLQIYETSPLFATLSYHHKSMKKAIVLTQARY
uniref:Cyclic nucleotide-binding domain-containing protein n=1 Tax=Globisporangium ultimum (strain ATCC 200006 / CBS 805.95 / DAOM BR144) TaxID=431595 RepID=K3X6M9_GLOUD